MRSVYVCVFELPDGEHIICTGPCPRERAIRNLTMWFSRNPEAKWAAEKMAPVTKVELDEMAAVITAKYPRRKPLKELFNGVGMLALQQGYRIPGSKLKRPVDALPASAWGTLGKW